MALPKPPIPLRTWPRVHCPQAQSTRLPICHNTLRNRPFHSTSPSSAAPSPAVQRARRAAVRRTAPFSKENLLLAPILDNARAVPLLEDFNRRAQVYWQVAREDNVLPQTLPYRDFLRVGGELIMRATDMPNERAVRSISTDVDMVYKIGYVVSKFVPTLHPWVVAACVRAGSKTAIFIAAARYFESSQSMETLNVPLLRDVQRFALTDKDPRAIVLYAMILSRQEKYTDVVKLLRPLLNRISPSKSLPSWDNDALLRGSILPPWEVLIHAAQAAGDYNTVREVERIAALEYLDPKALASYAYEQLATNDDFTQYEQYMCQAASAGNGDACFRLANFYYLTSLNLHPITLKGLSNPQAKQPEKGKVAAAFKQHQDECEKDRRKWQEQRQSLVGRVTQFCSASFVESRLKLDHVKLSLQWYGLACSHKNARAYLFLAMLIRSHENAESNQVPEDLLTEAAKDPSLAAAARSLRLAWASGKPTPKLPDSWWKV